MNIQSYALKSTLSSLYSLYDYHDMCEWAEDVTYRSLPIGIELYSGEEIQFCW